MGKNGWEGDLCIKVACLLKYSIDIEYMDIDIGLTNFSNLEGKKKKINKNLKIKNM